MGKTASSLERILEAAMGLFEERGFSATSVEEIASRAGVAKGSVYWHFRSKDDLLLAIVDRGIGNVLARVEDLVRNAKGGPVRAIETILDLDLWIREGFDRSMRVVMGALADAGGRQATARIEKKLVRRGRATYRRAHTALTRAFRRLGPPAGLDAKSAATCLMACMEGILHLLGVSVADEHDTKSLTRSVRALFLGEHAEPHRKGQRPEGGGTSR